MKIGRKNIMPAAIGRFVATTAIAFTVMGASSALADDQVRVWVDAGHGGKDPGAVAGGLSEKDSNLQIQKRVIEAARRQGWKVGTTRDKDEFETLTNRPKRAAGWNADVMVSLHSNSAGSKKTGHMTIYRGGASKRLGQNIMGELAPLTKYEDIGNRADSRGLAVLRGAKVPTVIVELLSVSNADERAQLKSPAAQREMAEAIVRGVAKNEGVKYVPPAQPEAKNPAPKPEPAKPAAPAPAPAAPKPEPAPAAVTEAATAEETADAPTATADAEKAEPKKVEPTTADAFGLSNLLRLIFG